jgi:PhzF family phenazine biosynthesis protein
MKSLGISATDLDRRIPVVIERDLYIPMKKLKRLKDVDPDFAALKKACADEKMLGVCLFTLETVEKTSAVHSRFFAPAVGINEDPVTGSANGPLGVFLFQYVLPKGIVVVSRQLSDGRTEFIGEQGFAMNRPGHVKIRVHADGNKPRGVSIAGEAVTVMNSIVSF